MNKEKTHTMDKEERMQEALDKARGAFWGSIVESYPEITTGDIDPLESFKFSEACRSILACWLYWNTPEEEEQA